MRIVGLLIILVLVILGVSFAILNSEIVRVNYYFGAKAIPLSIILIGSVLVGIILSWLVMFFKVLKLRLENRRLRKRLEQIEKAALSGKSN